MFFNNLALFNALVGTSMAGTLLWDGRFNDYTSSTELDNWSFENPVGEYQWYIHGDGNTTDYVNLSSDFANPADTSSAQGAKLTIDSTSVWNGQTMLRTELIPQTSAPIGAGKKYYHFSIKHASTNVPNSSYEHQVAFFESHFTEMKVGSADSNLHWYADSISQWNTSFDAEVWHNIAYGIDFDAGSVEFYHSTGAEDLTLTAGPVDVNASSNGADWHVGVLRWLATSTAPEDWYFSGVYVEEGDVTTTVVGPSNGTETSASTSAVASTSSTAVSSAATISTQAAVVSTSTSAIVSTSAISSSSSTIASSSTPTTLQTLVSSSSSAISSAVTSAVPSASTTTAAATTYACNPAHSYPNSQSCVSTNGSLTLVSPATTTAVTSSVSSTSAVSSTVSAEAQCVVEYAYV